MLQLHCIHISKSFHHLVVDKKTKYSILLECFTKLFEELNKVKPVQLLRLNHTFTFADKNIFESCLPKQELQDVLVEVIDQYPQEIQQLLFLLLKKFAYGFSYQKGAIFGFGDESNDDTGTVLKIADLTVEEIKALDNAKVHNLSEERSVGFIK